MLRCEKTSLFGMAIDRVRLAEAVGVVRSWIDEARGDCRYVVTPNADHVVLFQEHAGLRDAYAHADLVIADGWPVVLASRLLGPPLPERVTGSDLVPALFDDYCQNSAADAPPLKIYLLGAAPGVAERAAAAIAARWPRVVIVGLYSPPLGFEKDAVENEQIIAQVNAAGADLLVLGLGAPKQELWIAAHHAQLNTPAALCVGATIDFLAGEKRRAPIWLQRCGLEWLHRCLSEPRRLVKRYARDAVVFPHLVWREHQLRRAR